MTAAVEIAWAPRRAQPTRRRLERAQVEAEGLRLVEGLLDDREGIIRPQRAERRIPGQAHADGGARGQRIAGKTRQRGRGLVDTPERAGIGEHGPAQAEIL